MSVCFFNGKLIKDLFFTTFLILSPIIAQQSNRSVDQIEQDWKDHTSFQKNELLNFCDFLFDEGYYERSVLTCFRFIFLYPDDEIIPHVYYRLGRSYEESGLNGLAIEYFQRVQKEMGPRTSETMSALYRITHLHLKRKDYQAVHDLAGDSNNPYLKVFEGYANLSELKWDAAKNSFESARKQFRTRRYDRTLRRLIRACDGVSSISKLSGLHTGLFGIFPGGGRVYQQDWISALGTFVSTMGLGFQLVSGTPTFFSLWIPGMTLVFLYGGSILGSVNDVEFANQQLQKRYARGVKSKIGTASFLDFPEPGHLSLKP